MTTPYSKKFWEQGHKLVKANWTNIDNEFDPYTVPLLFFDGREAPRRAVGNGSGVLAKLNSRFFIFTAGHCVRDSYNFETVVLATGRTDPRYRDGLVVLKIVSRDHRYDHETTQDFGYIELDPFCGQAIESRRRMFASDKRIAVGTASEYLDTYDFLVVVGYPSALQDRSSSLKIGLTLYWYAAYLKTPPNAPTTPFPKSKSGLEIIDVWTPTKATVVGESPFELDSTTPELRGVSGGGCWVLRMGNANADWSPSKAQIVGVHVGSSPVFEWEGDKCVYYREVLLGHHLRLIAENDPTMRQFIETKWPNVADFPI